MTKKHSSKVALIIHAGAGRHPKNSAQLRRIQKKLGEILEKGYRFLKNHSALETTAQVTRWLEDWPETNAGMGAMLQADGIARLSAAIMDGHEMRFSGVINIKNVKNPILVAYKLQKERDRILTADGAEKFAREQGFKRFDPRTKESIKRWRDLRSKEKTGHYGTVGACALDSNGRLASATSTGGKGMERVGRVSDSALPAGNFANDYAAVSATGLGEHIVEEALASTIAARAADSKNLKRAFEITFRETKRRNRRFAAVGVDRNGNVYWNHTTGILYYAFRAAKHSDTFSLR